MDLADTMSECPRATIPSDRERLALLGARAATCRRRSRRSWLAVQEFGDELALGFKPVAHIMTLITTTSDIDLKSTVGDLRMGTRRRYSDGVTASTSPTVDITSPSAHAGPRNREGVRSTTKESLGKAVMLPEKRAELLGHRHALVGCVLLDRAMKRLGKVEGETLHPDWSLWGCAQRLASLIMCPLPAPGR